MQRFISTTPFIVIITPLVAGVVTASYIAINAILSLIATIVCFAIAIIMMRKQLRMAYIYLFAAIFGLGLTLTTTIPQSAKNSKSPIKIAAQAQNIAAKRLTELNMSDENRSIAAAMSIGMQNEIPWELRKSYAKVGAAHILAVSGLHVGMVFILINIALYFIPLFTRQGHIWKNIIAIMLIWIYAFIAGASPSIIRAALMFSLGQIAIAMTLTRSSLNIILASATLMICINPHYINELSFQLSYAATLSIILFFRPIYAELRCRNKIGNILTQLIVITLIASMGTAPLVAYHFESLPLVGLVTNIPVVILAHVILMVSLVWIIMPIGVLSPLFSAILEWSVSIQNNIVSQVAAHPYASFDIKLSTVEVVICYALMAVAAVALSNKNRYLCDDDHH